jgi:ribose transport system ATP-binding protein/inositol transport system ATP-binding protein
MKAISKNFPGVKALQSVDFGIDEGEVVALVGENGAGKSTLMNVLGGVVRRDSGEIWIKGVEANINTVADAQREGIAFIHQELSLFNQLSVQENLFIDNLKAVRSGIPFIISKKKMRDKTREIFQELEINIDPATKVGRIPMHEQQMVEIASAVLKNAKIIILDEPTTSLDKNERVKLYEIIKKLKKEEKIVIYITHEIENAINISDRVVCLRDGHNAGEKNSKELTKSEVVSMMIGSKAGKAFLKTKREIKDENILEFRKIRTAKKLNGVNMKLRKGEVLGLYGLIGSGRTELIKAIYGIDKIIGGELIINGKQVKKYNPMVLKKIGVAWLTENRRDEGLFLELGVNFNISITDLEKFTQGPFSVMNSRKESVVVKNSIDKFQIATPSIYQPAGKLSGGNQQKVVIAKWLYRNPLIFILDEPTRGIDVHAKEEIYRWIDQTANEGISIILISSEVEEIIGMSDRVVIMAKGKVVSELEGDNITSSNIIRYSMG